MSEKSARIITSDDQAAFQAECRARYYDPAQYGWEPSKGLENSIRRGFFRMIGGPGYEGDGGKEKIDGEKIRRIVLLRYDAVGDYIISTPLIRWLRTALPQASVDVISSYRNDSIAKTDPLVERTFPIEPEHTMVHPSWGSLMRSARRRDYDLLIGLSTNRMTKNAIIASLVAPRGEKISLLHRSRRDIYGQVFHHQVDRELWLEHWAETLLRMGTETIAPAAPPPKEPILPYMPLDQGAWTNAERFMRSEELSFGGLGERTIPGKGWVGELPRPFSGNPYCVVNISAHCVERQWAPERCAETCRLLVAAYPRLRIYISGAPVDAADVQAAVRMVNHPNCRSVSLKLAEFIGFIAGSSFVISPDTATIHIAAATGRPVLGLYAEEIKAAEWYPYGGRFVLLISPSPESINLIEPAEIVGAVGTLIEREGLGF